MALFWLTARYPWLTRPAPPDAVGFTTNHSIPALLLAEPLTAVPKAPHSLPSAKATVSRRVSLLSSAYSWLGAKGSAKPSKKVEQAFMFRQSASGSSPTFCSDLGGTTYWPTVSVEWERLMAGALSSDEVLVSDHTRSWFEVRGPTCDPLPWASSAAFELRKYSVPPFALEFRSAGAIAGHSVKPELPLSAPCVSIWVTATLAAPEARAAFEKAYSCAPWKSLPKNEYSLVVR